MRASAVGFALVVSGAALLTVARVQLGNASSVSPQASVLVTRGLYARIRNPVYVFGILFAAGLVLYVDRLRYLPLAVLLAVRARRESRVLEERFGDAYRQYRARTWF